jgi:luciferase family oxidoreductase group 1
VPIWILGSSTFGAQLAALLGLPYAFASHFAPDALLDAIEIYRDMFRPSKQLDRPYVMLGINVIAAESDREAQHLFTTPQQGFTNLIRGRPGPAQAPIDDIETYWAPAEKAHVSRMLKCSIVGAPATVRDGLERFLALTRADELMANALIYDHQARVRSYEILMDTGLSVATGSGSKTAEPQSTTTMPSGGVSQ